MRKILSVLALSLTVSFAVAAPVSQSPEKTTLDSQAVKQINTVTSPVFRMMSSGMGDS